MKDILYNIFSIVFIGALISIICASVGVTIITYINYKEQNSYRQRIEMLENARSLDPNAFYGGFYNGKGYYCIWTRDASDEDIASALEHEKCHALVAEEFKHFCESDTIGDRK